MNTANNQTKQTETENDNKPDWVVKAPRGQARNSRLERIGVAWNRDDTGLCVRLVGTQLIDGDIYLYPIVDEAAGKEGAQ